MMSEKKRPNSYLNPKSVKRTETSKEKVVERGVKIDALEQATVKIASDISAYANPYSVLANDFAEAQIRAVNTSFIMDKSELACSEVKLTPPPKDLTYVKPEVEKRKVEEVKSEEVKVEQYKPQIQEVPAVEPIVQTSSPSDIEILNNMSITSEIPQQPKAEDKVEFVAPKDISIETTPSKEQDDTLDKLNSIQALEAEAEAKKEKELKEQLETNASDLEALLAELEKDENGGFSING